MDTLNFFSKQISIYKSAPTDSELISNLIKLTEEIKVNRFFSDNEEIDDVQTDHLELILCPFYLGMAFNSRSINEFPRTESIKMAQKHLETFLKDCLSLGIVSREQFKEYKEKKSLTREKKIRFIKEKIHLKSLLEEKKGDKNSQDEENKRDYLISSLKFHTIDAFDVLRGFDQEKELAEKFDRNGSQDNAECIKTSKPAFNVVHIENSHSVPKQYKDLCSFRKDLENSKRSAIDHQVFLKSDRRVVFKDPNPPTHIFDVEKEFSESLRLQNANKDAIAARERAKYADDEKTVLKDAAEERERKEAMEWDAFKEENERGIHNNLK